MLNLNNPPVAVGGI